MKKKYFRQIMYHLYETEMKHNYEIILTKHKRV